MLNTYLDYHGINSTLDGRWFHVLWVNSTKVSLHRTLISYLLAVHTLSLQHSYRKEMFQPPRTWRVDVPQSQEALRPALFLS